MPTYVWMSTSAKAILHVPKLYSFDSLATLCPVSCSKVVIADKMPHESSSIQLSWSCVNRFRNCYGLYNAKNSSRFCTSPISHSSQSFLLYNWYLENRELYCCYWFNGKSTRVKVPSYTSGIAEFYRCYSLWIAIISSLRPARLKYDSNLKDISSLKR